MLVDSRSSQPTIRIIDFQGGALVMTYIWTWMFGHIAQPQFGMLIMLLQCIWCKTRRIKTSRLYIAHSSNDTTDTSKYIQCKNCYHYEWVGSFVCHLRWAVNKTKWLQWHTSCIMSCLLHAPSQKSISSMLKASDTDRLLLCVTCIKGNSKQYLHLNLWTSSS